MSDNLTFKLTLDGKEFLATANLSEEAMRKLSGSFSASARSMASDWGNIITGINQGIQVFQQFASIAAKPLQVAGQFEQYNTQLKVMLGSAELAKKRLEELQQFAATTPFTLPQVVQAGNQLQAMGRYSIETIRMLGDLAAASGKPFEQVMGAYAKLVTGQKGIAIDMFRDMLITSQDWANATGAHFSKSGEIMTSAEKMAEALPKILKEKGFDGMMAEQAKTLNGMASNFEDSTTKLAKSLGDVFVPAAKSSLTGLTKDVDDLSRAVGNYNALIKTNSQLMPDWINNISTADDGISTFMFNLSTFGGNYKSWIYFFDQATSKIKEGVDKLSGLGENFTGFNKAFEAIESAKKQFGGEISVIDFKPIDKRSTDELQELVSKYKAMAESADPGSQMEESANALVKIYQSAIDARLKLRKLDKESDIKNIEKREESSPQSKQQEKNDKKEYEDKVAHEKLITDLKKQELDRRQEQEVASAEWLEQYHLQQLEQQDMIYEQNRQSIQELANFTADHVSGAFIRALDTGRLSFKDFMIDIRNMIIQAGIKSLFTSLFSMAMSGGVGGATGPGGGGLLGGIAKLFGFAKGGVIEEPELILAGEKGPEIIAPVPDFNKFVKDIVGAVSTASSGGSSSYQYFTAPRVAQNYTTNNMSSADMRELIMQTKLMRYEFKKKKMEAKFEGDFKNDKLFDLQQIEENNRTMNTL